MRVWKVLGIAGLAGVAATGAVVVRHERHRRSYTAEEVRARLQGRAAEVVVAPADPDLAPDWPPEVEPPRRHPAELLLSGVMAAGRKVPLRRRS